MSVTDADEPQPVLWCRHCDEPVRRAPGARRTAVHAVTGRAGCADGEHAADPTATDPDMHVQARKVSAEFGGRWRITAGLGIFYAIRADTPPGCTPVPVDAGTPGELRERLRLRESVGGWAARDAARRKAGQS